MKELQEQLDQGYQALNARRRGLHTLEQGLQRQRGSLQVLRSENQRLGQGFSMAFPFCFTPRSGSLGGFHDFFIHFLPSHVDFLSSRGSPRRCWS